jgi:hypothetical protein
VCSLDYTPSIQLHKGKMSSTKRRKLDQDTASNASGTGGRGPSNGNNAATAAAAGGRRGGGGPGSRGGHSAATASRAAAAAAATVPASSSAIAQAGAVGTGAPVPYVPVVSDMSDLVFAFLKRIMCTSGKRAMLSSEAG